LRSNMSGRRVICGEFEAEETVEDDDEEGEEAS
jgi:hypothetical protein